MWSMVTLTLVLMATLDERKSELATPRPIALYQSMQ